MYKVIERKSQSTFLSVLFFMLISYGVTIILKKDHANHVIDMFDHTAHMLHPFAEIKHSKPPQNTSVKANENKDEEEVFLLRTFSLTTQQIYQCGDHYQYIQQSVLVRQCIKLQQEV